MNTVREADWSRDSARPWAYYALLLYVSGALFANAFRYAVTLPLRAEAVFPEAYRVYDAREYARVGQVYRAPDEPPYNPSVYSPLFYLVTSLPFRVTEPDNPFFVTRLMAGAFFAASVLMAAWISYALTRRAAVAGWAVLLGGGLLLFNPWVADIRADFMGALCGLASARLLLARSRGAVLAAGLCAGLAFAFKLTLVAAAMSGALWLLLERRIRESFEFALAFALSGLAGYFAFVPFEPHLRENLFALGWAVRDFPGAARLLYVAAGEPVFLLALAASASALREPDRRWRLVLLYTALSLAVAIATSVQPGASVNYFIEPLLAAAPLASWAALRLAEPGNRAPVLQLVLAGLVLVFLVKPAVSLAAYPLTLDVAGRNARFLELGELLHDKSLFSAAPDVSLLGRQPAPVTEPFLIRYLELAGRYDPAPLAQRLRAGEFDLVVTRPKEDRYRGVEVLSPAFQDAIRASYAPLCVLDGNLYLLPRTPHDTGALADGLRKLGCRPPDG
ncbi:MAG TPA: hypothetical protein VEI82_04390 [Myxococcota bacterium]|nr:hypothetical protein [Myxococcota bacterium]